MTEVPKFEVGAASGANSRRMILIAWLFTVIIVLALAFTYYGIGLLSSARAFVGGEGLWSKAQKDMVYALARYARYHNPDDYQTFLRSSAVNLGDRQARLELEKPDPDFALARAGFLQGRNHPDDIDGMIKLFRNFRKLPDIDKAIDIWARADLELDQLIALGDKIHVAVQSRDTPDEVMLPYLRELFAINQRLMPLEDAFSFTLGEAARKTKLVLLIVLFAGVSTLLMGAFLLSRRMVRQSTAIEHALRQGERQLRGVLQYAPLPMTIVRIADQSLMFANEHALRQFKGSVETLGSLRAGEFYVDPEDRAHLLAELTKNGRVNEWEVRLRDTQGAPFWASLSCQCLSYYGEDCILSAITNIEVRKRHQLELHHRAFHDELTGLPNRAMFMETLAEMVENQETQREFALMFLDVDRFKIINDELGHAIGDKLLQEVAARLRASVAAADIVARLGGDEFVILALHDTRPSALNETAHRIMAAIGHALSLDGHDVHITISIGISRYPHDGNDIVGMMKSADLAMYRAKERGRNNFQWHGDSTPANEAACD